MNAFCPGKTATGNLPNLSFMNNTSEPLGTEFKCTTNTCLEFILVLEVTRRKTDTAILICDDQ